MAQAFSNRLNMSFRVQARAILQLGAELISSDSVAFYELIKNCFDAGSKSVKIRIVSLISHDLCNRSLDELEGLRENSPAIKTQIASKIRDIKRAIAASVDVSTASARSLFASVEEALTIEALVEAIKNTNTIRISDTGDGMDLETLSSVYLTIGTRARYAERKAAAASGSSKVILGEKGIGRLSAMRLGEILEVRTTRRGEQFWNDLDIDWRIFSHDSDQLLEDIEVVPRRGARKENAEESGTHLSIKRLTSTWTKSSVEVMIRDEFSKFVDPFNTSDTYKIFVRFNGTALGRVRFNHDFLEAAQAVMTAQFSTDGEGAPSITGHIDYRRHHRVKTFSVSGTHLLTSTGSSSYDQLRQIGPFTLVLYWYNRKAIAATAGLEASYIENQVRLWAGGVMVYRDGFRVNPYGGPEDDWLGLDKKAFASGGYKLNRNQLIGQLAITSRDNPELLDQTNREGIRESAAKKTLVTLLRHTINAEFRPFLNKVEKEVKALEPLDSGELERRSARASKSLQTAWDRLRKRFPMLNQEREIIGEIDDAVDDLTGLLDQARGLVVSYEKGRTQLIQLAGIGLMVEFISHELTRATEHALRAIVDSSAAASPAQLELALESLRTQLRTINKRIRVLDPLSPSGRQTKERFDISEWVRDLLSTHSDQFSRHAIIPVFKVRGDLNGKGIWILAVKGMITQIFENLVANSVYWLKAEKLVKRGFVPGISVVVDAQTNTLHFSDNGPGIETARAEEVFEPFVTSKPPGEGKGLGLYIAREMARYHGCELYMSPQERKPKILNDFVFDFSNIRQ